MPPRALFTRKEWPEGYVFPACSECNGKSRIADQFLALLGRMSFADPNFVEQEFAKFLGGISNNLPAGLPILETDTDESKRLFSELDAAIPDAGFIPPDATRVAIDAETFLVLDAVFRKIFCALYYKHVGGFVPRSSVLFRLCTTNQILASDDPYGWQIIPHIRWEPIVRRNGRDLRDQFDYRWGAVGTPGTLAVAFNIRTSIYGIIAGPLAAADIPQFPAETIIRAWEP